MRKDRLTYFKKQLLEKQRQLADEVGKTALYGKDQEDDSIKDLGDQANTAYTREFFFELGNGDRRLLRELYNSTRFDGLYVRPRRIGICLRTVSKQCQGPVARLLRQLQRRLRERHPLRWLAPLQSELHAMGVHQKPCLRL